MQVSIGGKRLGSGNKMTTELHNYNRSTHNLSRSWKNSMTNGVLYPCFVDVALNGDSWEIDAQSFVRTLPTKGPLFGSFKMQVDFFKIPIRLYQGILHNNPMNIGLKMHEVKLPKIRLYGGTLDHRPVGADINNAQVATNSLVKFLGISGIGQPVRVEQFEYCIRDFNAVPFLAYYDIFKNYYANLQEQNAYVITPDIETRETKADYGTYVPNTGTARVLKWEADDVILIGETATNEFTIYGQNLDTKRVQIVIQSETIGNIFDKSLEEAEKAGYVKNVKNSNDKITFSKGAQMAPYAFDGEIKWSYDEGTIATSLDIKLQEFPLENIDTMRMELLSANQLGETYLIDEDSALPYGINSKQTADSINYCAYNLNGLVVKTYQSDLFNNWIQTEWIDGENGISAITAVSTADGSFTIDQLTMQKKIWDMLNRVAVSGGTYQDWQDAVYTSKTQHTTETPLYCGGMSSEIVFEEIVSTSESGEKPQGNLAGKGRTQGQKGGHIEIDINEPSIIMGIASITPRLDYSQGNKWYMTELDSIDDLHKPALDGIGFQDLIVEQMSWLDARVGRNRLVHRNSAGKVPAWINYMTAYDECFGDFANQQENAFMVLNRNYEYELTSDGKYAGLTDITTYIDPSKYNYAFAYSALASQNFWVQLAFDVKARRVMSAKIIPNL